VIPSLRERQEDIPQLTLHFAQRFAKELNREVPQFTPPAMDLLLSYHGPATA